MARNTELVRQWEILREVDASLKRLDTDWVDVLLVHWPDAGTPFEETMRGLEEVVASGRVRFVGVSNFTGAMMAECMRTHGVPNFPDPTFGADGSVSQTNSKSSGVDASSPQYQAAQKACQQTTAGGGS